MKLRFYGFIKAAALFTAGLAVFACNDVKDLEERLDSLESRIQALETQLPALNDNVAAISALVEDGVLISSVEKTENGYEITTSDGSKYTLTNGAVGNTPQISVNDDGNWIVSYDDGGSWEEIQVGGSAVSASGTAPQFRVDAEGYWQVSYDEGGSWVNVENPDGERVPATGEGSDFFRDIQYDGETFTVTLADGTELEIAVVADFLCAINGVDYSVPVAFEYGETKTYSVSISGVAETIVSAPEGWTAVLDGAEPTATLSVTAPGGWSILSRVSADTRSDISILAVSTKGLSAITKMKVELSAEPVPANPNATVTANDDAATSSSLSFTVTPDSDVTSWRYLLLAATESAPDEAAFESASDQTGTQTLVLSETADGSPLAGSTEYVLYVLPYNSDDDIYGTVASARATTATPSYDTYYERYEAGLDITIAGKVYNRATYGEATLVSEDASITSTSGITKVFFVDNDATLTYNTTDAPSTEKAVYQLIIIGNTPGQRSSMLLNSQVALNQGAGNTDGTFVAYNLDIDATNAGNYLFAQNRDGAYGYVGFINCHFTMPSGRPFTYVSSSARSYAEFTVEDSEIEIPGTNQLLLFSFGSSTASHGTISLKNNVLYSENGVSDFRLISGNSCSFSNFVFENNTVVNLWSTTSGCVLYSSLNTVSVTKNLFWTDRTTANMAFFRPVDTSAETGTPYAGNPTGTLVDDSIVYKNGEDTNWQWFYGGMNRVNREGFESCNEIVVSDTDPLATADFENGIFTPGGSYSQYGAQRD